MRRYLKQRRLAKMDVRHVFEPGGSVLLKAKLPWKLKCRSVGPFVFQEYSNVRGTNAIIIAGDGKRYHVSTANLVPVFSVTPSR